MKWVKVDTMKLKPYCCIACGSKPRDDDNNLLPAIFRQGVDVNWGDAVYICWSCARIIGELRGMLSPEDTETLRRELKAEKEAFADLQSEHEALTERVDRMLDGVKAKKEVAKNRREGKKKEPVTS